MKSTALAMLAVAAAFAQEKKVAITIDDQPRGGDTRGACDAAGIEWMTAKLLGHLRGAPFTGFVNEGRCPEVVPTILEMWLDAGADLGNHSYSHRDFNPPRSTSSPPTSPAAKT